MNLLQNMKSGFANFKDLFKIFLENNEENDYNIYINSSDFELSKTAQELFNAEQSQVFNPDSGIVKKKSTVSKKSQLTEKDSSIPKFTKKSQEKEEPEIEI